MKHFARVFWGETLAYAKTGLLASVQAEVRMNAEHETDFGVLFVPGLGASPTQFATLKDRLAQEIEWFDSFNYSGLEGVPPIAARLGEHIRKAESRCEKLLVIGHSLGGLLLRVVLQSEEKHPNVKGFVSICAPLFGAAQAAWAPIPELRALKPESTLFRELESSEHRLARLKEGILTISAKLDHFVAPHENALLRNYKHLVLEDVGHVGSLFAPRVHEEIAKLARNLRAGSDPEA